MMFSIAPTAAEFADMFFYAATTDPLEAMSTVIKDIPGPTNPEVSAALCRAALCRAAPQRSAAAQHSTAQHRCNTVQSTVQSRAVLRCAKLG